MLTKAKILNIRIWQWVIFHPYGLFVMCFYAGLVFALAWFKPTVGLAVLLTCITVVSYYYYSRKL